MDLRNLEILYEDNHLLAVNKPAGLLCQADASGDATLVEAAKAYLKSRYGKPGNVFVGLVHRLDRPVAGAMVLARTSKAAARLSAAFRAGRVEKIYRAVVVGSPPDPQGRLTHHLKKISREHRSRLMPPRGAGGQTGLARLPGSRAPGWRQPHRSGAAYRPQPSDPGSVGGRRVSDSRRSEVRRRDRADREGHRPVCLALEF